MKEFKLDSSPKISSGFKTPDNYFEKFSEKVLVPAPENDVKIIAIFKKKKSVIFMVAAIFIIALLLPQLFSTATKTAEVDDSSIETYLSYQSNVTQYDIINLLDEQDIDALKEEVAIESENHIN
ncbi:hypothetical protein FFWV33_08440 [Flavobacterium faecale]|uniref:Uncharacterized protein n=1 Tax=Flavobacterium faecale TaxID=1355330 RepID=A0A2S1LDE0_9FLAO|nr:hypothetical protein [Flavobacterium faecale]AWG21556.1 hypothetical protein FFWV33_08440 [Flavobacterium faecale]